MEKVGAYSVLEATLGVGGSQQEECWVPGSEAVSSLVVERGIMSLSSLAQAFQKPHEGNFREAGSKPGCRRHPGLCAVRGARLGQ